MTRIANIGWLLLCLMVLIYYILNRNVREADIIACYCMIALSFPIGWVAAIASGWLFFGVNRLFGYTASKDLGVIFFWLVALGLGYVQWFAVLPWVIRKIRAKREDHVA